MVKEDKQRPVYEPRPLLQRLKRRTHRLNRGRKEKQGLIKNMSTLPQSYSCHDVEVTLQARTSKANEAAVNPHASIFNLTANKNTKRLLLRADAM